MSVKTGTCSKCGGSLEGRTHTYCRTCMNTYYRERRAANPEVTRREQASQRAWQKRNPEKWRRIKRNSNLKRDFGITLHDFEKMLEAQGNVCAICKGELVPWPHLDHNHTTGKVREILCSYCNLGIGHVKDDPERADSIAAYLRRHS